MTSDRALAMAEMYAEGYSLAEVASKFGVSRQRVHQLIRPLYEEAHYGVRRRERYEHRIRVAHARLLAKETTLKWEAEELGVQEESLRTAFRRRGLPVPPAKPPAPKHGTNYRYRQGCHCDECTAAFKVYQAAMKEREPPQHGTRSGYRNFACRCPACKQAGSEANREYREKRKLRERERMPND